MMDFRKALTAAAMASVLTASQAMAADGPSLAPGKPAGVQAAQLGTGTTILLIGGAVILVAIAIAVSNSGTNIGAACGSTACSAPTSTRQ
jgi:hypothetical protein